MGKAKPAHQVPQRLLPIKFFNASCPSSSSMPLLLGTGEALCPTYIGDISDIGDDQRCSLGVTAIAFDCGERSQF
jgi:hypothetical protein